MRRMLFLLLIIPFVSAAQINRSAKEFAREKIQEYIVTKLFKDQPYKPVSYGELKSHEEKSVGITWTIEHKFEITETQGEFGKKTTVIKPYKFLFYLDDKMKVQKAESYLLAN